MSANFRRWPSARFRGMCAHAQSDIMNSDRVRVDVGPWSVSL